MKQFVLVVPCLFLWMNTSSAADSAVELKDIPAHVMAAVRTAFPEAKAISAGKRVKKGKIVFYNVEIEKRPTNVDVYINSDAEIVSTAVTISLKQSPKPLQEAVKAEFDHWKITEVQKETDFKTKNITFTVELTKGSKVVEAEFSADGELVSQESVSSED